MPMTHFGYGLYSTFPPLGLHHFSSNPPSSLPVWNPGFASDTSYAKPVAVAIYTVDLQYLPLRSSLCTRGHALAAPSMGLEEATLSQNVA